MRTRTQYTDVTGVVLRRRKNEKGLLERRTFEEVLSAEETGVGNVTG
jgi:hypothetical protein